jgi:hypothetical protein
MVLLADKRAGPARGIRRHNLRPGQRRHPSAAVKVTNDLSGVAFQPQANASGLVRGSRPPEQVRLKQAANEAAPDLTDG